MKTPTPAVRTKIVVTMGPAIDPVPQMRQLIRAGVDIFRANVSHGSLAEHTRRIQTVRRLARHLRKRVAILVDLPGPKYRLGVLAKGSLILRPGQTGTLQAEGKSGRKRVLPLRQPELIHRLKPGHEVYLNDGTVELQIQHVASGVAAFRVLTGGIVRSGSGINLPRTDLGVQLPTASDLPWIRFAAEQDAEWLAVSFVQTPEDIQRVREAAKKHRYRPKLMAKIEKRKALRNLREIIRVSDGVMVARGDLGVETSLEEVPFAQKHIIAEANRQKTFVVTATQMLESMVSLATPTRAEVSDVANAILDGTDAVMLSAESAIGKYPLHAVSVLSRVARIAEREMA